MSTAIPAYMRAMVLTGHGGPERLEYHEDWRTPRPGPGQVLVRVGACGINNTDLWTRLGAYGDLDDPQNGASGWAGALRFPRIQGADAVGRVVALGRGADQALLDRRVMVNPTLYGPQGLLDCGCLGSEADGGFAEYLVVPQENALVVESPLSDAQLGTFMTAYLTALGMLERAGLAAGQTVLVTGASGGVGTGLVQLAKLKGARVLAVVGQGKEELALGLGADLAVARGEDLPRRAREALGDTPLDLVADVVAGPDTAGLIDLIRPGGAYVVAGAMAGPLVRLDLRTIYLRLITLYGSTLGTAEQARRLVDHIAAGGLRPLLARTFALEELPQAQEYFQRKRFFGKLVALLD